MRLLCFANSTGNAQPWGDSDPNEMRFAIGQKVLRYFGCWTPCAISAIEQHILFRETVPL